MFLDLSAAYLRDFRASSARDDIIRCRLCEPELILIHGQFRRIWRAVIPGSDWTFEYLGLLLEWAQQTALVLETYILIRQNRDAFQSSIIVSQGPLVVRRSLPLQETSCAIDRRVRFLVLWLESRSGYPTILNRYCVVIRTCRLNWLESFSHIDGLQRLSWSEVMGRETFVLRGRLHIEAGCDDSWFLRLDLA